MHTLACVCVCMFVCLRNCKNILYWDIKTVECNLDHRNSILVFILGNVEELNVDSVTKSLKTCAAEAHCGSHYRQRGKQVINMSREEKSLTSALQRRSHFNLQSIGGTEEKLLVVENEWAQYEGTACRLMAVGFHLRCPLRLCQGCVSVGQTSTVTPTTSATMYLMSNTFRGVFGWE